MKPVRVAIMASGRGSNAEALISYERNTEDCPYTIACVITNKSDAGVLTIAAKHGTPLRVIAFAHRTENEISENLLQVLSADNIEFICLAGFLKKIPLAVAHAFAGRIINVHPSLLPAYGGKGMYGNNVFTAVLDSGDVITGVTIHEVSENYDEGRILYSETIEISDDESVETLAVKTQKVEHRAYPRVLAAECRRLREKGF